MSELIGGAANPGSYKLTVALIIVYIITSPCVLAAQACKGPDAAQMKTISQYLVKQYHLPSESSLVLVESTQANQACFWKLRYTLGPQRRELSLYVSPDRQFLTSTLFDLATDPTAEEKRQQAKTTELLLAGAPPIRGPADAPVTLAVFGDFQCPYCKRLADMLDKDVLPANNVRIVYKAFPLPMHPWAMPAAEIAGCVALQNQAAFWNVHDFIFENQHRLTADNIKDEVSQFAATQSGIDRTRLQECIDKEFTLGMVTHDLELGRKLGVHGTPTIFINGLRAPNVRDATQLRAIIAAASKGEWHPDTLPVADAGYGSESLPKGGPRNSCLSSRVRP